jgi:hypothetical protein
MPSKWTFEIKPINKLLNRYKVGKGWIDPFCGEKSWAEFKNDLNPKNLNAQYHLEAIEFLTIKDWEINGALFDPPYSLTQVSRSYNEIGLGFKSKENPTGGFPKVRQRLAELLKPGQHCISFGWNSAGLGKKNNMEIVEILIVAHGGNRNDTIVTVERKLGSPSTIDAKDEK